MTKTQKITVELINRLEELVDDFNQQGAVSQSTQLSGLLDDYYMAVEELDNGRTGKGDCSNDRCAGSCRRNCNRRMVVVSGKSKREKGR